MSDKIRQLKLLLKLARNKEEDALRRYAKVNQYYQTQLKQFTELNTYRQEYRDCLSTISDKVYRSMTLQTYDSFVSQLDVAIDKHNEIIEQAKNRLDTVFNEYVQAKQKSDALERILEAEKTLQRMLMDKREQKENDEYARNQWYINRKD